MVGDLMNISSVETYLDSIFNGKLSDHVFYDGKPPTTDDSWNSFVVVDCGNSISDMNAYGRGTVLVMLYTKPTKAGTKNVAEAQRLEKTLNAILAGQSDSHYHVSRRTTYTDYDETFGLHCNIVILDLIVL